MMWLGRNSGASGDFQLTRLTQQSRKFFPERILTSAGADRSGRRDRRRQFVRLNPTAVAYPRAALRVPVAFLAREKSSDRCRKCVIAPPTESCRWPETPNSVRQTPLGRHDLCRRLSVNASGVGKHLNGIRASSSWRCAPFAPGLGPESSHISGGQYSPLPKFTISNLSHCPFLPPIVHLCRRP